MKTKRHYCIRYYPYMALMAIMVSISSCGGAPQVDPLTTNTYCVCAYNGNVISIGDANCMINGVDQSCSCVINENTNQQETLICKLGVVGK